MKKILLTTLVLIGGLLFTPAVKAQSIADLIEELSLDYQKLAGMKSILKQMEQGYRIVSTGYNNVKGIAQGNFNVHEVFLDGLLMVSPTVRTYPRIKDIINDQAALVTSYKSSYEVFRRDKNFSARELSYMSDVYNNLIENSLQNLDELTMIMADNKLRMSDAERLAAIDRVYASGHEQLTFIQHYNNATRDLAVRKAAAANDQQTLQELYGIK
ncbi:MAG: TerB family tellurite resistance protein [Flavipsychrobacter sp.]